MKALAVIGVVALAGCATAAPGGANFSRNIGTATEAELMEYADRVLTLHQFEIERQQPAPSIYIETRWRDRLPFDEEAALGVEAAQVRAIIRARPRSNTSGMGLLYTVDMGVEQRVKLLSSSGWRHVEPATSAREFAARIIEDLRRELKIGVRRY